MIGPLKSRSPSFEGAGAILRRTSFSRGYPTSNVWIIVEIDFSLVLVFDTTG